MLSATVPLSSESAIMTTGRIPKRCMAAAAKGPMKSKDEDVDPDCRRDAGAGPPELSLQGNDQDAGCRPNAGAGDEDQEDEGDDDPGKVNAGAEKAEASAQTRRLRRR